MCSNTHTTQIECTSSLHHLYGVGIPPFSDRERERDGDEKTLLLLDLTTENPIHLEPRTWLMGRKRGTENSYFCILCLGDAAYLTLAAAVGC